MTRREIRPRRHCVLCDAYVWPYFGLMYATPEAAAHARARYCAVRASWRHMRAVLARSRHATYCACRACDPLYDMTREGTAA